MPNYDLNSLTNLQNYCFSFVFVAVHLPTLKGNCVTLPFTLKATTNTAFSFRLSDRIGSGETDTCVCLSPKRKAFARKLALSVFTERTTTEYTAGPNRCLQSFDYQREALTNLVTKLRYFVYT